ncbi:hypothetical protein SNL152K_8661 [Streptomyces sp. NL15-2K]|nr:hypothetical protein SNL152K_8661 [Streptomyces sp. NL15-2K]
MATGDRVPTMSDDNLVQGIASEGVTLQSASRATGGERAGRRPRNAQATWWPLIRRLTTHR